MTFALMKQLLTDPVSAINDARRSVNQNKVVKLLIAEWVFIGIGLIITLQHFGVAAATGAGAGIAVIGIVVTLFVGFLVQMVLNILGGRGNYWTGLTVVVYPKFPFSVGIIVSSILFLMPFFGMVVGAFFLVIMAAMALSVLYRSVKDLFKVDMITAWIGISVLLLSLVVAVYLSLILLSASSPSILSMFAPRY